MPAAGGYGSTLSSTPLGETQYPDNNRHHSNGNGSASADVEAGGAGGARSVLLFGLSANPPTGAHGHAGIVDYLAGLEKWDEIWVMPVYRHMHAKNRLLLPFEHRMAMCRLNFDERRKGRTRVRVMDIEREVVERHYRDAQACGVRPEDVKVGTIDTVLYAQERMPHTAFALVLGTDTYRDLKDGKWKRGFDLKQRVSLVVVARPGVHFMASTQDLSDPRVEFHSVAELGDVSSTSVRMSTDRQFLRRALQPAVLRYVLSHALYRVGQKEAAKAQRWRRRGGVALLAAVAALGALFVWSHFRPCLPLPPFPWRHRPPQDLPTS